MVAAEELEVFFRLESFVRVEVHLELDMHVPGGVVVEQAPSDIFFACNGFAS